MVLVLATVDTGWDRVGNGILRDFSEFHPGAVQEAGGPSPCLACLRVASGPACLRHLILSQIQQCILPGHPGAGHVVPGPRGQFAGLSSSSCAISGCWWNQPCTWPSLNVSPAGHHALGPSVRLDWFPVEPGFSLSVAISLGLQWSRIYMEKPMNQR